MSKYDELCTKLEKTNQTFEYSKQTIEDKLSNGLATLLGCSKEFIIIQFSQPRIEDSMIVCDFSIQITIQNLKVKDIVSLTNLSYLYGKKNGNDYFAINYQNNKFNISNNTDGFCNIVFCNLSTKYL